MPRPVYPPTPGSSTDIRGKNGIHQAPPLHLPFELPPPAIHDLHRFSLNANGSSASRPTGRFPFLNVSNPTPPVAAVRPRRRSSAAREQHRDASFALPPPPTRSRKIIQMNPQQQAEGNIGSPKKRPDMPVMPTGRGAPATGNKAASAGGTDAAGRKLARKTAHSLIERRRRSKMNEEFAVLKAMIPACTGEMHKLAILQASIEYVRYLQDCVAKLKAKHDDDHGRGNATHDPPLGDFHPTLREDPAAGEAEMTDSDMASPNQADNVDTHRLPSISPALWAQDHHSHRRHSYLRNSRDHGQHGYSMSACTSPAFGPQRSIHHVPGRASASASTLTSPMLLQSDFAPEASSASGPRRSIHHVPGRASASASTLTSPMLLQCDFAPETSGPRRSIHHVPGRASASASTLTSPMLLQCDFVPKASPAFGPQRSIHHVPGRASASESRPTSPMLHQCDFVHEASSALLMLNNDGRDSHARGRGLSVRDLLSADV
ncbi:hypothetical protein G6O67_002547 [Ophiocordyceps sinensis]|uniref:BHLH domain-containing protein n=1 Tax=Ophiocordyceps sinensis TaxID=72228 RepID=A0A8H4PUI8_9HYPO|nr:hypothetical protein G6O67_002547 [Ophiocordyceps sinensis]